jgi:glycosyltransferase involved in cell wall biosynthesis
MVPRLAAAGHDVAIAANFGLNGATTTWEHDGREFTVYPAGMAEFSNDVIPPHALDWFHGEPGWLMTLYDVWAMRAKQYAELNIAAWTPVDHMPCPPAVKKWFADYGGIPIAMSRFGEAQLRKADLEPLYAPHGIDTNVFRPHSKAEAKQRLGLDPDKFLVGMVSTNAGRSPSRKAHAENLSAYSFFHADHPDTHLYYHSDLYGHHDGLELDLLAGACAIPEDALTFVDQYDYRRGLPEEQMAWRYSAMDVLLFATMGEGFGIPAIEAQACGTPVIVSEFSAQPELVAPGAGYTVGCQPWWDPAQKAFFVVPLIEQIGLSLDHAYQNRDALADASFTCREFALGYDADRVFTEYWDPILEVLKRRLPSGDPIKTKPIR